MRGGRWRGQHKQRDLKESEVHVDCDCMSVSQTARALRVSRPVLLSLLREAPEGIVKVVAESTRVYLAALRAWMASLASNSVSARGDA